MERIIKKLFFAVLLVSVVVIRAAQEQTNLEMTLAEDVQSAKEPQHSLIVAPVPGSDKLVYLFNKEEWYAPWAGRPLVIAVKSVKETSEPEVSAQDEQD